MMERLAWTMAIFLLFGVIHYWVHVRQRRQMKTALPGSRRATLFVVTSSTCSICPAQKKVVAQLHERYPSLQVMTIEADTEAEKLRHLSVMTVPTTLLQAPGGEVVHINNGFIALEPLAKQVDRLMQKCALT